MPSTPPPEPQNDRRRSLTPARLEAFSDGVLAVIITIMVLELHVPSQTGLAGLHSIVPTLLVYALSFGFTGIYWVNHHLLINRVEAVDPRTLYTNLLFLFTLSLLPFFTSWLVERDHSGLSVLLYTILLIAVGVSFLLLRLSIQRRLRLAGHLVSTDVSEQRKHLLSLAFYAAALAISLRLPLVALLCDAAVNLIWVLPHLGAYHVPAECHLPTPHPHTDLSHPHQTNTHRP